MDVKQIAITPHASVAASTEASDREGRQNNQAKNRRPAREASQAIAPVSAPQGSAASACSESEPQSQMLDSEKTVQLLAQRSQNNVKKATTFQRMAQASESKKPSLTDEKKLNKSA